MNIAQVKYSQWAQEGYAKHTWKHVSNSSRLQHSTIDVEILAQNGFGSEQVTKLLRKHQRIYGEEICISV